MLDIARDFIGCGALFFDRGRNSRCDLRYVVDRCTDALDRNNGVSRGRLNLGDLAAYFARGLRGLSRKRLHLRGYHREPTTRVAGASPDADAHLKGRGRLQRSRLTF